MRFTKMHGAGNDFVVLDGIRGTLPPLEPIAARIGELFRSRFGNGSAYPVRASEGARIVS